MNEYDFTFDYNNIDGNHYIFKNKYGYIEFYEWEQFNESSIFVKYDMISKRINLIEEYPKVIGKFNQTHKGFKWFFKDKRDDYWEMISEILKLEINSKNNIFGLKL